VKGQEKDWPVNQINSWVRAVQQFNPIWVGMGLYVFLIVLLILLVIIPFFVTVTLISLQCKFPPNYTLIAH
jgi:hypothetical protein